MKALKSVFLSATVFLLSSPGIMAQKTTGLRLGGGVGIPGATGSPDISGALLFNGFMRFANGFSLEAGMSVFPEALINIGSFTSSTATVVSLSPSYYFKTDNFVTSLGIPFGFTNGRFVTGISGNFDFIFADRYTLGVDLKSYVVTGSGAFNLTSIGLAAGVVF